MRKLVLGTVITVLTGLVITAIWQAPGVLATKEEVRVAESKADFVTIQVINSLRDEIEQIKEIMPPGPERDKKVERIEKRIQELQNVLLK